MQPLSVTFLANKNGCHHNHFPGCCLLSMKEMLSRREFLKLGSMAAGTIWFGRYSYPDEFPVGPLGRVSTDSINVYNAPNWDAETVDYRFRDELLNIYYEITPKEGPAYNPLWYRVWGGYVHSGYIQPVEVRYNPMQETIREGGQLVEVTVPYSSPYLFSNNAGWESASGLRLYYSSIHWVTDIVQGPDKLAWYQITDELWDGYKYYVPTEHLRMVEDDEISPVSADVPHGEKKIEVSRQWQTLTAYEYGQVVMHTTVSTGVNRSSTNGFPTITPVGRHNVRSKMPSKHMGATDRAGAGDDTTSLPGVPWTSFFAEGGYAIHGTYWHNNFGIQMSRGCINMRNQDAKWLFRWLLPENTPQDWEARGFGTLIEVT